MILRLEKSEIVELLHKEPADINGLRKVLKDQRAKQWLILDARGANCHFLEPEDLELPYPWLFMQL